MELTITLTDHEAKVLSTEYNDIDLLFNSQLVGKIRKVEQKITQETVQHCLDNGLEIPSAKEDIVDLAFTLGLVDVASERVYTTPSAPIDGGV
jgi:hypothetical protein